MVPETKQILPCYVIYLKKKGSEIPNYVYKPNNIQTTQSTPKDSNASSSGPISPRATAQKIMDKMIKGIMSNYQWLQNNQVSSAIIASGSINSSEPTREQLDKLDKILAKRQTIGNHTWNQVNK